MSILKNKNIVLGVSGGIAAYKSPDLVRRLQDAGADVQVVMTSGAQQFVTPLTFQAVSGRPVRGELFDREAEAAMGHIELARWADAVLIAPASANFMARLTQGRADDLITTVCLATEQPICIAPAMNRVMWADPATVANANSLAERGVALFGPGEGDQACGETGSGRMLEPLEIVALLEQRFEQQRATGSLSGTVVVITAGPTRERLDPVRYLTNRSSGKMGYALADAARDAGAQVILVSGPVELEPPAGVECVQVESAQEMHDAVHQRIGAATIFISAAAVADFRPANVSDKKIKKTGGKEVLELEPCPDIVKSVAALNQPPFTVGFAAETNNVEEYARKKLQNKKLNMIAANQVGDVVTSGKAVGFESDDNELLVLTADASHQIELDSKSVVARQLIALVASEYAKTQQE